MSVIVTPAVLVPRFTTIVGTGNVLQTLPIDVRPFKSANITAWRGGFIGTGLIVFGIQFLESTDRNTWDNCPGTTTDDPGAGTEKLYTFDVTKRWFRVALSLNGTNPGVTCWAQGFFINREE